jgi:predicted GH43/DUF377 family glycosyl hydrolase
MFVAVLATLAGVAVAKDRYDVSVRDVTELPVLSSVDGNSDYLQAFNPTWVQPTFNTGYREGILVRSQNCSSEVGGECVQCGGDASKASVLAFAELDADTKTFKPIDASSVVFGPYDASDSWGTEDPRMQYNKEDELYYMFYTAYNGTAIDLSLATTKDPTNTATNEGWTRHGPVFPSEETSKSAALLLRTNVYHEYLETNYLFWGDSQIRVTTSDDLLSWPSVGETLVEVRADSWDSKLVEAGPPPLLLSTGDYLFFYNSAMLGWPDAGTSYNVGYVILSGKDPKKVLQRSETPLLSPEFAYQQGVSPYTCNMPNVVFLEAAKPIGNDQFTVYFGAADNTVGSATVVVKTKI